MSLVDLLPWKRNPRRMSARARTGLLASIRRFGLVEPVVWNEQTKRLVAGHQRVLALEAIGETGAEVVVVDLPESEEKVLNLALNNPAIAGEFTTVARDIIDELMAEAPALVADLRLDAILDAIGTDEDESEIILGDGNIEEKPAMVKLVCFVPIDHAREARRQVQAVMNACSGVIVG